MTCRERVIAAIRGEPLDHTPHNVCFTTPALEQMIAHTGNPNYEETVGNHIHLMRLRKPKAPVPDRDGYVADEFGVVFDISGADKDIGTVAGRVIPNIDDMAAYEPPAVDELWLRAACTQHAETAGDRFTVGLLGFSLFERVWSLFGMEDLLCAMVTDPDAVHALLRKINAYNLRKVEIAIECGFDGILFGDDWGSQRGLIMGPERWRALIKPYANEMYAAVKSKGRIVLHHSCGDCRAIMGDLAAMGLDVYQTFQPEIYGLNKLPGIAIWGGISTQADLPFRTPEEIYALTRRTMEILGAGGGYIAAPTHDIPADVPPENVEAMVRAFKGLPM